MDDKAVLNLFLSLDELYQMIDEKSSNPLPISWNRALQKTHQKNRKRSSFQKRNKSLTGKLLTNNEVLFEKFFQGKLMRTAG